ncbi:MAG: ParA family protein [Cyanothece sp. SIO2G6]|nr:ParA family protein [Cyanothece sp. SIO2G6]
MTGAGGVGKTTLSVNLGYEIARRNKKVAIFDLDPQGSINVACRLNKMPAARKTTAWIYSGFFGGEYSLTPVWEDNVNNLSVFQGGSPLFKIMPMLAQQEGILALRKALETYPLKEDLIIFDCPATLETLPRTALAAATHLLIPLVPDPKAIDGTRVLIDWYLKSCEEMDLNPKPEILGFVINNVEKGAEHQRLTDAIIPRYEERGWQVFGPIRHYTSFVNAWSEAVPLRVHRTTHPALPALEEIRDEVIGRMK